MLEEQESRMEEQRKLILEDEELFEEMPCDEESEDELYDEDVDEIDEEEMDETDEDGVIEDRPRKRVPANLPSISDAEQAIVENWWELQRDMHGIEQIREHIEEFMRDHPELVPNLELHEDLLFVLGGKCIEEGRIAEYIDLLLKMRSQFPDSYLKGFGVYDRDIISYKIITGHKEELKGYLDYFKEYPEEDPDNLFKTMELMIAKNCQDTVSDFVKDVYYDVCTSPHIIGGNEIVDTLVMAYFIPFLKPEFTRADMEELAALLTNIRVPLRDEYYQPDFLKQHVEYIFSGDTDWSIANCKTRAEIFEKYYQLSLNFMGFLHQEKGKDWLAADFYRKILFRYLVKVVPEGKRPKGTFVFTKNKIEQTIERTCGSFIFVNSTAVMVSLSSIYWFAEYLETRGSITRERSNAIQGWCLELHEEIFPGLAASYLSVKAFEVFPA